MISGEMLATDPSKASLAANVYNAAIRYAACLSMSWLSILWLSMLLQREEGGTDRGRAVATGRRSLYEASISPCPRHKLILISQPIALYIEHNKLTSLFN